MMLGTIELRPGDFTHFLVARKHQRQRTKRTIIANLSLTSMVDMFSLLVIFLLQSFSTSPELLVAKGVTLPLASTGTEMPDAPVLAITKETVFLDQKTIGTTAEVLKTPDALMEKLAELRKSWIKSHPGEAFKGEILLQADKEMPSTVLSQIMAMLPSQHYGAIQLAVIAGRPNG